MNAKKIAVVAAALVPTLAVPVLADDTVFGFSAYYVAQDIAEQGYDVSAVEEWGEYVVATVVDEAGHTSFKYFDPDTLTLVR